MEKQLQNQSTAKVEDGNNINARLSIDEQEQERNYKIMALCVS